MYTLYFASLLSSLPPCYWPWTFFSDTWVCVQNLLDRAHAGTTSQHTMLVDGVYRTFRLHIPQQLGLVPPRGTPPAPLVLNYHGWGSSAAGQERSSKMSQMSDSLAANATFISVYPEVSAT
jgi:poly(3-hydroxybutyrate) depolymerase